ncbi:MAG: hypothetical protein CEE40_11865 [Chloroflexi bacterium B3_Chlor]|nr:MAG: hypothetical protein CEE40_11865 [Chloroflexi bacterium B3_Chlor]
MFRFMAREVRGITGMSFHWIEGLWTSIACITGILTSTSRGAGILRSVILIAASPLVADRVV